MKIIKIGAMWCPACLIMNSRWNKIKDKYSNYSYEEYDYDIDENEVSKWNVGDKLPVVIILNDENKELERLIGEYSESFIEEILNRYSE